jgi:predicted DNA-binding protein
MNNRFRSPSFLSEEENVDDIKLRIEDSDDDENVLLRYESSGTEEDISMKPLLEKKYRKITSPPSPLTHDIIYNSITRQKKKTKDYQKEYNKSYQSELKLLQNFNIQCEENWNIKNTFINIDIRKLNEYLKNQFYNKYLLDLNTCVINYLLYSKFTYLLFFSSIQYILPNSASKYETQMIASTNFKGYLNDNLILKFDINKYTLHETVCGLLVGNEMRKILPTFVWTYGITKCTTPIISKDGREILTACNEKLSYPPSIPQKDEDNEYISVIIEKLEGLSLYEYIKQRKLSQSQLISVLLIVFSSISLANKKFGFVHNDLHSENIIMRPLQRYSCIKLPGTDIYVNTYDAVPVIFDYGISVFEMDNKKHGNFDFVDLGIDPNDASPMQDVIKLLIDLKKSINDNIVNKLLSLLFEDNSTIELVYDNYSYIPNINKLIKYNIDEFIQIIIFLSKTYSLKDLYVEKGMLPVLNFEESDSIDMKEIKKVIFTKTEIENLIDLDFYFRKDKLSKDDLQKIVLFLLYFNDSYVAFMEKAPSNNLKPETIIQKFFKIKNHIDTGKYLIELLNKLEKQYGITELSEIKEDIENHIEKLMNIYLKYKSIAIIKKDYFVSPKIMNKKIKNLLLDEKYSY